MIGTVRIQGGDATANNTLGANWLPEVQVTTQPTFLTKVVVFVPTAVGSNRVIWIFNDAAGTSAGSKDPIPLVCPNGVTTTLDFGDYGKLFTAGVYILVATQEPANANDVVDLNLAANNDAKVTVDYKIK